MTRSAFVFLFRVFRVSIGLSRLIFVRTLRGTSTKVKINTGEGGGGREELSDRVRTRGNVEGRARFSSSPDEDSTGDRKSGKGMRSRMR